MDPNQTTAIAVYGACLSTIVFFWNAIRDVSNYVNDRPHLRVAANYVDIIGGTDNPLPMISITTISIGKDPLTVDACGFKLDNGSTEKMAHVIDPTLPTKLARFEKHETLANIEVAKRQILYAWARDSTGKYWRSKNRPLRQ